MRMVNCHGRSSLYVSNDAGIRRMRVVYMVNCHGRSSLYVSIYDAGIRRMRVVYMVNCHGRSSLYVSIYDAGILDQLKAASLWRRHLCGT